MEEGRLRHDDVFAPKIQTTTEAEVIFINRIDDEATCGIRHKQSSELALNEINPCLSFAKNETPSVFLHPRTGIVRHAPQN